MIRRVGQHVGQHVGLLASLLLAGLLALLGSAGPALAADTGSASGSDAQISHFEQSSGGLSMLVSVPADAAVDLGHVSVTIAGQKAPATAKTGSSGDVRRTAILAIDTSTSMTGAKFASAKQAAAAYVATLPDDVYLGVVTFGGTVKTALRPTQDRTRATSTLAGLSLGGDTLLYDGLKTALDDAGSQGQRSLLVLSDGADTRSGESLSQATAAIKKAGALVQVVAVDQEGTAPALQQLADAGKGAVIPADADALKQAFTAQASELARQVLVTAEIPAGLSATQGTVAVTLPTQDGATLSASAYDSDLQAAPAEQATGAVPDDSAGWAPPTWVLYLALAALAIGLFVLLLTLLPRPAPTTPEDRVTTYTERTGAGAAAAAERGPRRIETEQVLASARTAAADLLKRNASIEARIARALDGAGSSLKPAEWLLLHVVIAVATALVGLLLGRGDALVALLFLAGGVVIPWLVLAMRRDRRRRKFAEALPDTLQLMAGSLSAGLSLAQTVDTVTHEGMEPIASEFRRALVETRLGVNVEDALEGIATRFDSADFGWVVMAIRIQRQVGGNLAELFTTVAATLRERQYLRRQVLALSAEGRLSAWVIGTLPPLFTLFLLLTNRTYLRPLFHDPRGVVMLVFGCIWFVVGAFWMSKIVKVEV